jgi:hypothetical protein
MRDLQNLYVRANTCVACHQNVDADILKAGHPELIFELDGQSVAEPKHWSAEKNGNGAQAWLVGQAVALREMSWQLANEKSPTEDQENRWLALVWVLKQTDGADASLPTDVRDSMGTHVSDQKWADQLARAAANIEWTPTLTRKCLNQLLDKNHLGFGEFSDASPRYHARRAERLVLALDRLVAALPELKNNEPVQSSLNQLFKLAQSIPDFDPKQFAGALQKFSAALAATP